MRLEALALEARRAMKRPESEREAALGELLGRIADLVERARRRDLL
jgi:hypothetical protein